MLAEARAQKLHSRTFAQCVDAYLDQHSSTWRNDKHRRQWRSTLNIAVDAFGDLDVRVVDTAMIVGLLTPIWAATPETGSRLRGRVEKVLDWASAVGLRDSENPARWKGHLQHVLKARPKSEHHAAYPWEMLSGFVQRLRERDSVSSLALEFLILTAARTGEVIGAKWDEIDLAGGVWTIPAARMKAHKEHRVPLSDRAVEILVDIKTDHKAGIGDFVFPGAKEGQPLSNMAMLELLKGMDGNGYTVHGFRSSFRDWAGERSNYPREVIGGSVAEKEQKEHAKLFCDWMRRPSDSSTKQALEKHSEPHGAQGGQHHHRHPFGWRLCRSGSDPS